MYTVKIKNYLKFPNQTKLKTKAQNGPPDCDPIYIGQTKMSPLTGINGHVPISNVLVDKHSVLSKYRSLE